MLARVVGKLPELPRTSRQTLIKLEQVGVGSIPLVLMTSVFVGAVAAVQAAYQFQDYVPLVFLGTVVGKSVSRDLREITDALNNGEGTMGRLLKDDDMAVKLESAIAGLDSLIEDIKLHPGRYLTFSLF